MADESWVWRETGNTEEEERSFISKVSEGRKKEEEKGRYQSQPFLFNSKALALLPDGAQLQMLGEVHWVRMRIKDSYRCLFWGEESGGTVL